MQNKFIDKKNVYEASEHMNDTFRNINVHNIIKRTLKTVTILQTIILKKNYLSKFETDLSIMFANLDRSAIAEKIER